MQVLYFHGGPGLNSHPEEAMLCGMFERYGWDVAFWNEPSRLRPEGPAWTGTNAFSNYLAAAEQFLLENGAEKMVLIGHSFGCHVVRHLSKKYTDRVLACVFISPDLDLENADRNMFAFTLTDYKKTNHPEADNLQQIIHRYTGQFDENTENGFELVIQNPVLFDHYWFDHGRKDVFLNYFNDPGYQVDVENFFVVRRSWYAADLRRCDVPALAIFGRHDIVISDAAEIAVLRESYLHVEVHQLEYSAHYPHIEQTEETFAIIERFLR